MHTWYFFLGAAAIFVGFVALCILFPFHLAKRPGFPWSHFDQIDATQKTWAQIFGGAAVIFAFAWTFVKDRETMNQGQAQAVNQEYVAAITLLKESGLGTRAAAIYSLGRVAAARDEYAHLTRRSLASFILQRTTDIAGDPLDPEKFKHKPVTIPKDVQAAIDVLGQGDIAADIRPLGLDRAYLFRALFADSAHEAFKYASFRGAFLPGADLHGLNLTDAKFEGAQLGDFEGVGDDWDKTYGDKEWSKWKSRDYIVNFSGSDLTGAQFQDSMLTGADFSRAILKNVNFTQANLSRAIFTGAVIDATTLFKDDDHPDGACADEAPVGLSWPITLPRCS